MATTAVAPFDSAPTWRRQPFRSLFPLGVALAWCGVLPWLAFALGRHASWPAIYHSVAQTQGFMICFVTGFLFTALPRRTKTPAPNASQMLIALLAPPATVMSAAGGAFAFSQIFWFVTLLNLALFALPRMRAEHAPSSPATDVWIPTALMIGAGGTVCVAAYGMAELDFAWHQCGRGLLVQGFFVAFIAGVGSWVLPLMTRGARTAGLPHAFGRGAHTLVALTLIASFFVEAFTSAAVGYGMRAAVVATLLLGDARLHHPPTRAGAQPWLIWIAAWLLPIGYLWATLDPDHGQAGLHVVFIGGFALMALSIGLHVSFAHAATLAQLTARRVHVTAFGILLAATVMLRALVTLAPARIMLWLGAASALFLMATISWSIMFAAAHRRPTES